MICEEVIRYADLADESHQLPGNILGVVFSQGADLRMSGGVIHNCHDVFMATGRLQEWPYQVYTHPQSSPWLSH